VADLDPCIYSCTAYRYKCSVHVSGADLGSFFLLIGKNTYDRQCIAAGKRALSNTTAELAKYIMLTHAIFCKYRHCELVCDWLLTGIPLVVPAEQGRLVWLHDLLLDYTSCRTESMPGRYRYH